MSLILLFFQSRVGVGLVTTCEIGGVGLRRRRGGDFYAGIGDHRLVIERKWGKGRGEGRDEKMKILPFFYF